MIQAIRKLSAVDEVFQVIQQQIVRGELPVGHRFPPQEVMAEQLGVSRSTIREAINKLTLLGFLAAKPGVGTTVVGDGSMALASAMSQNIFYSFDDVPKLLEARLYLEKAAARLAVLKASDENFQFMEHLLNLQEEALVQRDSPLFFDLDVRFHQALVEGSKNQMMIQFLGLILNGLSEFIREADSRQKVSKNALQYHKILFKHLKNRDLGKMEKTLTAHVMYLAENIERLTGHDLGLAGIFSQEIKYGCVK